jgi:hypothetical protein
VSAMRQHTLLLTVMVEAGTGVVRARRRSAAWRRAERTVESVGAEPAQTHSEIIHLSDLLTVATAPMASSAADA